MTLSYFAALALPYKTVWMPILTLSNMDLWIPIGVSEHQLTLPHIYSQNLHRNFKQSHLQRWLAALRASGIGRDHAAGVFKVQLLQLLGIDVDGWRAALETVQEEVGQCKAHDGMLSQSAASLSAELAQTTKALARLQGAYQEEQITVAPPAVKQRRPGTEPGRPGV